MKKIALMTWHHVTNYGTALQAYALSKVVRELGFQVDLIDYRRTYELPLEKRSTLEYAKGAISQELHKNNTNRYNLPYNYFERFYREQFSYTSPCKWNQDFYELNRQYDGFLCGSDQIWGPEWFDPHYFLDFVEDERRLIAYAPSIGVDSINHPCVEAEMRRLIKRFRHLSVREKTGGTLIECLTGLTAKQAVDPVLLIPASRWKEACVCPDDAERPYMLIFLLKNNERYFQWAKTQAKILGLSLKVFHCTQSKDTTHANINAVSPFELLGLINSASYVCTDSFHVMLFSILFNIQFTVFMKDAGAKNGKGGRITDITTKLGCAEALFSRKDYKRKEINFKVVNKNLEIHRIDSLQYLLSALRGLPERDLDKNEKYCEREPDKGFCEGMLSEELKKRMAWIDNPKDERQIQIMKCWGFSLNSKCYGCKWCRTARLDTINKKPLFYDELCACLKDRNVLVTEIFNRYYRPYEIAHRFKRMIMRVSE